MSLTEEEPSWLRPNRETPLMGSGKVLGPPGNPFAESDDGIMSSPITIEKKTDKKQQSSQKKSSNNNNGSKNNNKKKTKKVVAKDWHVEEEDDDYEDDEETQLLVKKKKKSKKKLKARKRPSKHCMLTFFHGFELISSIPLLVLLAIQIFPIVMVPIQTLGYLQTTIRIYESLFVLILILVEWRVPFLRENYLLQTFFTRGFLHTFAAVLAMEEAFFDTKEIDNAYNTIHLEWAPTLGRKIAFWSVFAIGCLYMIFGIFCLQILRNTLDTQHKEKMEEYEEGR